MRRPVNRRLFLRSTTAASLSTLAIGAVPAEVPGPMRPVVVASGNGLRAVEKAMTMIKEGRDPLDAAIEGVAIVEADPKDHSVGREAFQTRTAWSNSTRPSCTGRRMAAVRWRRSAISSIRPQWPDWS